MNTHKATKPAGGSLNEFGRELAKGQNDLKNQPVSTANFSRRLFDETPSRWDIRDHGEDVQHWGLND